MSDNELEKKRIIDEILNSLPPEPDYSAPVETPEDAPEDEGGAAPAGNVAGELFSGDSDTAADDSEDEVVIEDDFSNDPPMDDTITDEPEDSEPIDSEPSDSQPNDSEPDDEEIYDEEAYGDLEEYVPRRRRKKSSAKQLIIALLLAAVIVSLSVLGAAFILGIGQEFMGIGRGDSEIVLDIPDNLSTEELTDILHSQGIIGNKEYFSYFARVRSLGNVVSGFHEFRPNMTYGEIADELQSSATNNEEKVEVRVTFPEGIRLTEAAKRLEDAGVCSADEFLTQFNTLELGYGFEDRTETKLYEFYRMEGYCFPDTYNFYEDENVKSVVQKIFRNTESKLTPDIIARAADLGLTQDELLTFASIVQREVPSLSDMRTVASVFWNRENDDTFFPKRFESCTTSPYINEVIMQYADYTDSNMIEAYDTYTIIGLPPGPICNPGLDAINAVLYPADTTYLYFCSNLDTKETFFANTLDEQEENMILAGLV
jgi:UPF0755 protein